MDEKEAYGYEKGFKSTPGASGHKKTLVLNGLLTVCQKHVV